MHKSSIRFGSAKKSRRFGSVKNSWFGRFLMHIHSHAHLQPNTYAHAHIHYLNLPPLEIFVSYPKIFLTAFFLEPPYFLAIYGSFVTPSKYFFPFQIFRYNLNFATPLKVPLGADRPHRPLATLLALTLTVALTLTLALTGNTCHVHVTPSFNYIL